MLPTDKTDQAYYMLTSYAHTPDQEHAIDDTYTEVLADNNSEDRVVIALLGLILDGLRFGNWLWNTPPTAQNVILDSPPAMTDAGQPRHWRTRKQHDAT